MAPLRWGVVGTGNVCHDFVNSVLSNPTGGHQFVAVSSRKLESAKKFASHFGIPKCYGSTAELAKDPDIEVVYVAVITPSHYAIGKLLLESGKHLLMETPLAANPKQARALVETAKRNGRFLMEGLSTRFTPAFKFVAQQLSEGCIGEVVHASFNLYNDPEKFAPFVAKPYQADISDELGVFPVTIFNHLFGVIKPEKVAAVRQSADNGMTVVLACSLLYEGRRSANFVLNMAATRPDEIVIHGTSGQIKLVGFSIYPTAVEMPDKTYNFPAPVTREPLVYDGVSFLQHEADEVKECLQKGLLEHPRATHAESVAITGVMEEIQRQLGIAVPEGFE